MDTVLVYIAIWVCTINVLHEQWIASVPGLPQLHASFDCAQANHPFFYCLTHYTYILYMSSQVKQSSTVK